MLEVKQLMLDRRGQVLVAVLGRVDALVLLVEVALLVDPYRAFVKVRLRVSPSELVINDYAQSAMLAFFLDEALRFFLNAAAISSLDALRFFTIYSPPELLFSK